MSIGSNLQSVPLDLARSGAPAFIVVGKTGSGKTTLINTLFGEEVGDTGTRPDVTLDVLRYVLRRTEVAIYDTPGAGGLDDRAEESMRSFLQLSVPSGRRKQLPADLVIFLFSHERVTRFDIEFFSEVNAVYGPRLLLVKNYRSEASEADNLRNLEAIEARCGRRPIPVDAKTGAGIEDLIREMLRLLPAPRLLAFNESLRTHRQRARQLARAIALKYAASAAVARSEGTRGVRSRLRDLLDSMRHDISKAYIDDLTVAAGGRSVPITSEDTTPEAAGRVGVGVLGGILIGLLGGPLGAALGAFLGGLFGAGTTPRRYRGGTSAVVEFLAYARCQADILDEALAEPSVALTRGEAQARRWLDSKEAQYRGMVDSTRDAIGLAVRRAALTEALDSPNTRDSAEVELWLRPVVDGVF